MGLLDNLFKPKPDTAGEKSVESAESGEQHGAALKASPFLAPKIYVPRSSVQIVPPARTPPQGDRTLAPTIDRAAMPKEIVLTLGDVFSRIPTHFLKQGAPDLRRELKFPAEGLAADIARGRAAVLLAEIVAQCPDLFLPEANGFDEIQIRLPLQKLVEQIGLGATNLAPVHASPPPEVHAPVFIPKPPPSPTITDEAQIHLSLAAIMRRCPSEIIVHPLPPIADSVRIAFPFAPIERQLSTGQVEVSSLRFIAALPLDLMKCFEARAGVKVPLPLEEIFQNLPNQSAPRGVETRMPAVASDQPEVPDPAREDARLAESILLEPIAEPSFDQLFNEPRAQKSEPMSPSEPEPSAPLAQQPAPSPAAAQAPQMEVPPAEEAPVEIRPPAPIAAVAEIPPTMLESNIPRSFGPPFRPPVILQPLPEADAPKRESEPPSAPAPEPPPFAAEPPPPVIEPVMPPPSPVAVEPVPIATAPGTSTLRIGPPQFRPFVVHAPPIVLAPAQRTAFAPPPEPAPVPVMPEPVAPPPIFREPVAEIPPPSVALPEVPVLETPAAPAPITPASVSEGSVRIPLLRVCEILAALPGIQGCIIVTRSGDCQSGELPPDLAPSSIRELSQRLRGALTDRAQIFRMDAVQHLTLHTEPHSLSLFTRGEACVCAVHRARIFLPGVRERFAATAEELGSGV